MKKIIILGIAIVGLLTAKSWAQTISTLPLQDNIFCQGESINISYAVNGVFAAGNVFSAQLSDNVGSFASPVIIGSVASTASGNISASIPLSALIGTAYRIRVVASNPVQVGTDNGNDITINALPLVTFTAPADVCSSADAILLNGGTGAPAGGLGIYSGQGVFSGSLYPNFAGSGTFTLTYTYTDLNGCVAAADDNITVFPAPSVTLDNFNSICLNESPIILTGGLPTGGLYSVNGITATQFNPAAYGAGNQEISYLYTDINGCADSASRFITINENPIVTYSIPSAVCEGTNVNLLFSPSGGILTVDGTPNAGILNAAAPGTYQVSYSFTDNITGCINNTTLPIVVNANPIVTLPATATYCAAAGNIILSGGLPTGGYYSGVGVFNDSIFYPSLIGSTATTVLYNYTDINGCSSSASQNVSLTQSPVLTINIPSSVCIDGGIVNLSANPPGGVFTGTGVAGATFDPSTTGLGTFVITYSFTDVNGCSSLQSQNISVIEVTQPIIQPIAPLCVNASPVSYTYSPLGGTFSGPGVVSNTFNPTIAGPGTHQIIYNITHANGCNASDTIAIVVNDLPAVDFTASPSNICINASSIAINTVNPSGGAFSGNGVVGNNFSPQLAGVGTHIINYTYTDINGCVNSDTSVFTVNALPNVTFSALNNVCNGLAAFNLAGGNPQGGAYSGIGVTGGNLFNPAVSGPGIFSITYTYTDSNNCVNNAVQSLAVVDINIDAGLDQNITCGLTAPLNTTLNYNGSGFVNYTWTPTNGLSNTNIANPFAAPGISTTYVVNVSDGVCTDSDTVQVNYAPVSFGISFTASPLTFNQAPPYVVNFTNPYASLGQYNFTWDFGDGFTQFNNNQNFSYTYFNNGSYIVSLVAQDIVTGCIDTILASFSIDISGNNCLNQPFINEAGPLFGCNGLPVLLSTNSVPNAIYQWYYNGTVIGGANDTAYNCSYGTQQSYSGFYSVLVNDTLNNCINMSNVVQVLFNQPPPPPVITIVDPFDPCTPNNTATLQASAGYVDYAWQRLISPNIIGNQQTITINQTGIFNVIVTDSNGCTSSAAIPIANFGPDPSSICFVSVDIPSQRNFIYWANPTTTTQIDSFLVLRKSDIQFGFDTIATKPYDANAVYYQFEDVDDISIPTWGALGDTVNTAAHYYTYGLALKDVCGGTSIPNLFHTTINLQVTTANNGAINDLTWNAYGGLPFGVFELHKETTTNPDSIFATVSSNSFSYPDTTAGQDTVLAYWVTVPLTGACDTVRAASIKTNSNTIRRDVFGDVGIKSLSQVPNKSFSVFPNPNSGNFTLRFGSDFGKNVEINILSITGAQVWQGKFSSERQTLSLDLPDLINGVYLIQVKDNNIKYYKKMVISK